MANNINIYEGDVRLFMEANGSTMIFKGGQPIMDGGLEMAVLISLFTRNTYKNTDRSWPGNILFDDPNQKIGSDFEESLEKPITADYFRDVEDSGEKAIEWLIANNQIKSVDISVINPESYIAEVDIFIKPPYDENFILRVSKNSNSWVVQKLSPAHGRI
jgi:phage gp46-like protein